MRTTPRMPVEEFLALPETEPPSELIDGEIVQKAAPNWYHSVLTSELIGLLGGYLRRTREGRVTNELRHVARSEERVFLPDLNVTLHERTPRDPEARRRGPIEAPPDFAIEVLSPEDYPGRVLERADFYMRSGTRLLWIVDPELESITVYRPGEAPVVCRGDSELDAAPVLTDFRLELASLFAILHEE